MDFKSIDQLTISDCCNHLSISRDLLKQAVVAAKDNVSLLYERAFGGQSLTGINEEIARKLIFLLIEDRRTFLQCKTLKQFEQYLSSNNDGLWCGEALKRINEFKDDKEEKEYYIRNQNSIEGLERYLHKYPRGIFALPVRKALNDKKRIGLLSSLQYVQQLFLQFSYSAT